MFDSSDMASRLQNDMAKIQLDNTVDMAAIQADIIKKTGGLKQNAPAKNPITAPNMQYQSAYIPPAAYQGQYLYNYNWQQPAVYNAYAAQQNAYNAQIAQPFMPQNMNMQTTQTTEPVAARSNSADIQAV